MNKKTWISCSIGLLLLLLLGAWAAGMFSTDPQVTEIQALRDKLRSPETEKLPPEERRKLWEDMRQKMQTLPEEQRREMFRSGRQMFQERMAKRVDEFFALPKEKRMAALDKQIDEMEAWRRQRERQNAGRGNRGGGQATQANGSRQGNASRGRRSRGQGPQAEQARNQRRKSRLDETDPKMRAQMREYRRLMEQRRRERGLPDMRRRWS